jgi:hypothetical protein
MSELQGVILTFFMPLIAILTFFTVLTTFGVWRIVFILIDIRAALSHPLQHGESK